MKREVVKNVNIDDNEILDHEENVNNSDIPTVPVHLNVNTTIHMFINTTNQPALHKHCYNTNNINIPTM